MDSNILWTYSLQWYLREWIRNFQADLDGDIFPVSFFLSFFLLCLTTSCKPFTCQIDQLQFLNTFEILNVETLDRLSTLYVQNRWSIVFRRLRFTNFSNIFCIFKFCINKQLRKIFIESVETFSHRQCGQEHIFQSF